MLHGCSKFRFHGVVSLLISTVFLFSSCSPRVNLPAEISVVPKIENEKYITRDGAILPVRSWLPEQGRIKALVVALHGFNDYSKAFSIPGAYLSRFGIAVYAFDQRGFGNAPGRGLWSGADVYACDLKDFVNGIKRMHPAVPVYVLGESMGGAITIVAMTGESPPVVDGLILVAPAVWSRDTMPWYQRWLLALASHTVPWMELTGKGLGIVPSDNSDMLREFGRDPLVIKATRVETIYGLSNLMDEASVKVKDLHTPALVQYGLNDQVIPREPTVLMLERAPATMRKAFYEDGYHMLLRDINRERPLADIAAWISDRNRPLPFGAENFN